MDRHCDREHHKLHVKLSNNKPMKPTRSTHSATEEYTFATDGGSGTAPKHYSDATRAKVKVIQVMGRVHQPTRCQLRILELLRCSQQVGSGSLFGCRQTTITAEKAENKVQEKTWNPLSLSLIWLMLEIIVAGLANNGGSTQA